MPMMTSQILRSLKSRCVEKKTYFFSANKKIVNYTSKATSLQKNSFTAEVTFDACKKKPHFPLTLKHSCLLFHITNIHAFFISNAFFQPSLSHLENTVISPNFLVRKFCGKVQFSHSFG